MYNNTVNFFDIQSVLLYKINTLNQSYTSDIFGYYGPIPIHFSFVFNYIFIVVYIIVFLKFKGHKYLDDLLYFGDNRATLNCYVSNKKLSMKSIDEIKNESNKIMYENRYNYMYKYIYVIVYYKDDLYKISRVKKRFGKFEYKNKYLFLKSDQNRINCFNT